MTVQKPKAELESDKLEGSLMLPQAALREVLSLRFCIDIRAAESA